MQASLPCAFFLHRIVRVNIPEKKELATQKKGVVLGDGCETGCNSVLGPMSFVGKSCIVYPNVYVANGIFPEALFSKLLKTTKNSI